MLSGLMFRRLNQMRWVLVVVGCDAVPEHLGFELADALLRGGGTLLRGGGALPFGVGAVFGGECALLCGGGALPFG